MVESWLGDCSKASVWGTGYKDLSQIVTVLGYIKKWKQDVDTDELEEIMQKLWVEYFARRVWPASFVKGKKADPKKDATDAKEESNNNIGKLVTFNFETALVQGFLGDISGKNILKKYWTSKEIIRDVQEKFSNSLNLTIGGDTSATVSENGLKEDGDSEINYSLVKNLNLSLLGEEVTHDQLIAYITIAYLNPDHLRRSTQAISFDKNFNTKLLLKSHYKDSLGDKKKKTQIVARITTQVLSKSKANYFEEFKKAHFNIIPMKWDDILKYCASNGLPYSNLKYNAEYGLVTNACQSRDCPHFLKYSVKRLRDHLGGWQEKMPRGFHQFIRNHMALSDAEVYQQYVKQMGIGSIEKYDVTKDDVMGYIAMVKRQYERGGY